MGWVRFVFPALFFITLAGVIVLWMRGDSPSSPTAEDPGIQRSTALVRAVEQVSPTVVGILAVEPRRALTSPVNPEDLWLQELWKELAPVAAEEEAPRFGSGIVIDSKGFFLTNDHLVGRANRIYVTLPDGRQFEAETVGSDPRYDLAVIKVRDPVDVVFETSPIGDSDGLLVGEWVIAVGNPYGYLMGDPKPSVTAGVISALHRDVQVREEGTLYKDMIQTDASINPGNSGGPLVNAAGEVIGINTFIFSQGGVGLGIGFAIPIRTAMELAGEIILYGHVRGVWTGLFVQPLTGLPLHVVESLGVTDLQGVVVWTLERGSPADRDGIRLGDIIRGVGEERVGTSEETRRAIFGYRVGDTVEFAVERKGELLRIPVTLGQLPTERGQNP